MEAASITIQQIKHGFSKNNEACLRAILPSILNELSSQMTTDMKNAQKLKILQDRLPEYKDMINNFMTDVEDETHVIYLVTLCCSQKLELLGSCFYLILQLLYNEEVVHEQAILDWIASARARIANAPPEEDEAEEPEPKEPGDTDEQKREEGKGAAAAEGSYGDEEEEEGDDYDDGEDGQVSIKAMKMFVSGVSVIIYIACQG